MKPRKPQFATITLLIACITTAVAAQQANPVLGKTDLQAWIDDAPALPKNLEEAAARKASTVYQTFYERVEAFKKSYKQSISSSVKPVDTTLNNNPIIAQMGGMEKLAQMTPEQRAQAAAQMKQQLMKNPAALSLLTTPVSANNDTVAGIDIQQELQEMIHQRSASEAEFRNKDAAITNSSGSHHEINQDAAATLAKIPILDDPVMGRVHNIELEATLNKETAERHRVRATKELEQRIALLNDQKLKLKDFASAYQKWVQQNLSKIKGPTTEVGVAEYELSFIDAATDLAKYSEAVTKDVALYQEMTKTGNASIRKMK